MRLSVEIVVYGDTIEEIERAASSSWKKFCGDDLAEVPDGSEIVVSPNEDASASAAYRATVMIRAKREHAK